MSNSVSFVAVIDFETTSLSPEQGKVIEGAVALVELDADGRLGETRETYWSFNDPGTQIPEEIVKLTGITDVMVEGHKLDWAKFNAILDRADIVIAHNASFDRGWLEVHGAYRAKRWGCSLRMIDWHDIHDMPCRTLKHLAWETGFFPNAHRAIDDVQTLVKILQTPGRGDATKTYGQELIENSRSTKRIVFATGAPFETKDILKRNGFRWSPEKKVWWKLTPDTELESLSAFLRAEVYRGNSRFTVTDPVDDLDPQFKAQHGLGT